MTAILIALLSAWMFLQSFTIDRAKTPKAIQYASLALSMITVISVFVTIYVS
jgi:uncharacterized membrane protein